MIVGLVGGKGSGKNSVATYLEQAYGAKTYAIAGELKELLRHTFGLSQEQLHGTQVQKETFDPRWGLSPRQLMERQGDALRAVYGDQFQVARLILDILDDARQLAVISDIRFEHEAKAVRVVGALWRLHYAPGLRRWPITHSSEASWMKLAVDHEITPGPGGIPELHATIDRACAMFAIARQKAVAI